MMPMVMTIITAPNTLAGLVMISLSTTPRPLAVYWVAMTS